MERQENDGDKRPKPDVREALRMNIAPITVTPHYTHDSVMDAYEQIENFEKEHG